MAERYVQEIEERKPENNEIQWGILQIERDREMNQYTLEIMRIIDTNVKLCTNKFKANIISQIKAKYRERTIEGRNSYYLIEQIQNELGVLSLEDRDPTSDESNLINTLTKELEKERRKFQNSKPKFGFYIDRTELMQTLKDNKLIELEENNQSLC